MALRSGASRRQFRSARSNGRRSAAIDATARAPAATLRHIALSYTSCRAVDSISWLGALSDRSAAHQIVVGTSPRVKRLTIDGTERSVHAASTSMTSTPYRVPPAPKVTTPMLALIMPPLQAAAILLPLLIIQDAISVFTYRRNYSLWNLKVLVPGAAIGMTTGGLFAGYVSNAVIEITVGAIGLFFVLLIAGIGFSRIYLRAHWFSDVIGGYAAGLCWLCFCLGWLELRRRGQNPNRISIPNNRTAASTF